MFQTFISRHNSNFFSDKLVLTSVTPASSAPVLQTPKATSDRKSGSAGMPRPTSYAVFCLKKKGGVARRPRRRGVRLARGPGVAGGATPGAGGGGRGPDDR